MNLVLIEKLNALGDFIYKFDFSYYLSNIPETSIKKTRDGIILTECPKCHYKTLSIIQDKNCGYCRHCDNSFINDPKAQENKQ